jgi:hypothetical protein
LKICKTAGSGAQAPSNKRRAEVGFPTDFDRSIHLVAKGSFGFSSEATTGTFFYRASTAILKSALTASPGGASRDIAAGRPLARSD